VAAASKIQTIPNIFLIAFMMRDLVV